MEPGVGVEYILNTPCHPQRQKIRRSSVINTTTPIIQTPGECKSDQLKPEITSPLQLWLWVAATQLPKPQRDDTFFSDARVRNGISKAPLLLGCTRRTPAHPGEAACTTCDDSLPPTCRWRATFSVRHRRKQWLLFSVTAFWLQNWKLKMAAEVSSWLVATFPNCTSGLPTSVPFPTQVRILRYQSTDRATVKASPTPSWKVGNITFVKRQGLWDERLHFKNKF